MALADGAHGACSPRSHYDVIVIMTSFATELAMPSVTYKRAYACMDGHLSIQRLLQPVPIHLRKCTKYELNCVYT